MTHDDERSAADEATQSDAIERLVRLAGSRPTSDADRMRRVREAVEGVWRDSIRQRARRRTWTAGSFVLAAAACVAIAVSMKRPPERLNPPPAPNVSVARLVAATGPIARREERHAALRVGDEAAIGSAFETGPGVLATFALRDGGEVRVNERTVVRFAAARELHVDRGAIYLDSGPRSGSLVIHTPVGVVRDIGTRFEVGIAGRSWRVRVRDGLVRYERGDIHRQASAATELIVDPDGRVVERPSSTYGADWGWVVRAAPAFQVEGQTLAAFLDWVARESGRRIEFSSEALRRESSGTILHGSIEGLTAEEALDVILPACGLVHRIDSQRVIVSKPETPAGGQP